MSEDGRFIDKEDLQEIIRKNIIKLRIDKGLTQAEFSERIEVTHDYYRQIESSKMKKGFSYYTLYKICIAFDIPMESLFIKE